MTRAFTLVQALFFALSPFSQALKFHNLRAAAKELRVHDGDGSMVPQPDDGTHFSGFSMAKTGSTAIECPIACNSSFSENLHECVCWHGCSVIGEFSQTPGTQGRVQDCSRGEHMAAAFVNSEGTELPEDVPHPGQCQAADIMPCDTGTTPPITLEQQIICDDRENRLRVNDCMTGCVTRFTINCGI